MELRFHSANEQKRVYHSCVLRVSLKNIYEALFRCKMNIVETSSLLFK